MSDSQNNPKESGTQKDEETASQTSSVSQPMPTGSSPHYATDPIQFRVRGSTITGASPPSFVSLEDVMKAAHGFQNMALAHEIAVDQDFKLEPFVPPDNSYQKLVKETLHRAYFDILREQLNSDPPQYKQALILMEDVKQGLFSILLPRHTRIKQMIEEVLDAEFIKQQAENNSLDFKKYATFVIDLMAKLAAPARDALIQNITTMTDTVEIFRCILETLELLKLDLANTLIAMIRPHVQAESVTYERNKFDEMLKVQEDGLEHTKAWLRRHLDKSGLTLPVHDIVVVRNVTAQTLAKAYLELLIWDEKNNYPETITLDAPRFLDLGVQVFRLISVASILLSSPTCAQLDQNINAQFKKELKQIVYIIMDTASTDMQLNAVLPSISEQVILHTEQLLEKYDQDALTDDVKELIRNQIAGLRDPEHRVRVIVRQRVLEFLKEILVCGGGSRQVPVGLSAMAEELTSTAGTLLRYVMHNKAVFTEHYYNIIREELARP